MVRMIFPSRLFIVPLLLIQRSPGVEDGSVAELHDSTASLVQSSSASGIFWSSKVVGELCNINRAGRDSVTL